MLRSLKRDESGIAMGLAIILIVLVGVMGAGLLVFVQRDLEAVVETNRGQDAFEAADAGIQAAERQLLSDACPESYDGQEAGAEDEDDSCANSEESDWSYAEVEDENDAVGRRLDFDGKQIDVRIRHLPFSGEAGCTDTSEEDCAPDNSEGEEDERHFFRVVSEGESASGNARRKVESILYTYDLGIPKAYYSPEDIEFNGTPCIKNVSVFSLESIKIGSKGKGSGCPGEDGDKITGKDLAYGDWENTYNSTARGSADAGFAAVGGVDPVENGRDYDDDTEPQFVAEPSDSQEADEITFPFNYETQQGDQDEDRLGFFREEALKQMKETGDSAHFQTGNSISEWPENSTDSTVVYVEADEKVRWGIDSGGGKDCEDGEIYKGTLIVDGGSLEVAGNKRPFSGATIVRDGTFESKGNSCWNGFVSADEGMKIAGTPDPFVSNDVVNRPGFYGIETWSWRELYE